MTFHPTRRQVLTATAALAALPLQTIAQEAGPIEWVVPFQAGGASDAVTRMIADQMSKSLGRSFVIANKPGAGTQIGTEYVVNARTPTLLTADFSTLATNPSLYPKLRYDGEKDLVPIGLLARAPVVLITSNDVPANTLAEFIAWGKGKDGLNYGSSGTATAMHLAGELFKNLTGLKLIHVPYRGSAPAVQDAIGNQIQVVFVDLATAQQHILAGKVKAIALASTTRVATVRNVPTFIEQGFKNFEAYAWQAAMASTNTPAELRARLVAALDAASESAFVKDRFQALGLAGYKAMPEQVSQYIQAERQRWGEVIKTNNIKVD